MNENKMPSYIYKLIELEKNNNLNLLQIGWEKCKPNYSYTNYRNIYIFHFVYKGKGKIQTEDKTYYLSENSCFLYRANDFLTLTADNEDPWEISFFAFDGALAENVINNTLFYDGSILKTINNVPEVHNCILKTLADIETKNLNEFETQKILFEFLSYISKETNPEQLNYISKEDKRKYISLTKKYIQQNFEKPITISSIAGYIKLSRTYLFKIFKSETGKNIDEYLISVRLNEARRLLHETEMPIESIAYCVGFNNYSAFFKMFRKTTGMSPSEYRKNLKGN